MALSLSRPDVTFAVTLLAKHITVFTVWSANDDKRVARLIGYLHKSHQYSPVMCIRDPPELLNLSLYRDADFGGDIMSMRSTSGFVLAVSGPSSFAPVSWGTKRQSVVSRSTTESECPLLRGNPNLASVARVDPRDDPKDFRRQYGRGLDYSERLLQQVEAFE